MSFSSFLSQAKGKRLLLLTHAGCDVDALSAAAALKLALEKHCQPVLGVPEHLNLAAKALAKKPGEITLAGLIEAVEGPVKLTRCCRITAEGRCAKVKAIDGMSEAKVELIRDPPGPLSACRNRPGASSPCDEGFLRRCH